MIPFGASFAPPGTRAAYEPVRGTVGQISAVQTPEAVTLGFPSAVAMPGSLTVASTLDVGGMITAHSRGVGPAILALGLTSTQTLAMSAQSIGNFTLVGGTVFIGTSAATGSYGVFLSRTAIGGTAGNLTYVNGGGSGPGFTINSSSGTDTSSGSWLLVQYV